MTTAQNINTEDLILIEEGKVYSEEQADLILQSIMAQHEEDVELEETEEEHVENELDLTTGKSVDLYGSFFVGRGIKQKKHISGEIIKTTDKAILVQNITDYGWANTWIPKSAITNKEYCGITDTIEGDLKKWFVKS
jgi:hypothetical protein